MYREKETIILKDVESELSVLAGLWQHGQDGWIELRGLVKNSTFTEHKYRIFFDCFVKVFEQSKTIDIPILFSVAAQLGLIDYIQQNIDLISLLEERKISIVNLGLVAKKIARLELGRFSQGRLRDSMSKLEQLTGEESGIHILSLVEKPSYEVQTVLNSDEDKGQLIGKGAIELIENLLKHRNIEVGISSGMKHYDEAIGGGFRRKIFNLLAARRKIGKSILCINIGLYVAQKLKIPVLYLDTEMTAKEHQARLLANMTGIPIRTIERSLFYNNPMFVEQLRKAACVLEKLPIKHEEIGGCSFEETLSIARRWAVKEVGYDEKTGQLRNCLIIYDYFKLVDSSSLKNMKEYEAIYYQATALNNFCKEMDLACLAFVQLNREMNISQSDRLTWLAGSVCSMLEKDAEEMERDGIEYGNRKIVFDCCRHGEGLDSDNAINLNLEGPFARITEIGTTHEMLTEKRVGKSGFSIDDDEEVPF